MTTTAIVAFATVAATPLPKTQPKKGIVAIATVCRILDYVPQGKSLVELAEKEALLCAIMSVSIGQLYVRTTRGKVCLMSSEMTMDICAKWGELLDLLDDNG